MFPENNSARGIHLGEVAHHVTAQMVRFCHDVEEERLHVVVQRLVVQEQLGQQAQILAVDLGRERVWHCV